jgi:hypothetical protein
MSQSQADREFDGITNANLLDAIGSEIPPSEFSSTDPLEEDEEKYLEDTRIKGEVRRQELLNQQFERNIQAREYYAELIFKLVCSWLFTTMAIVIVQGFDEQIHWFKLDDKVLITLITTTTITVVGLFQFVVRYLYNIETTK